MPNPTRHPSHAAESPIFVVGTHYSGATLLSLVLSLHPNIVLAGPTDWLPAVSRQVSPILDLAAGSMAKSRQASNVLASNALNNRRLYEAFGHALAPMILPAGRQSSKRLRWVDCSPSASQNLIGLIELFPNARVIHLTQDVATVSQAITRWPHPDGLEGRSPVDYWMRIETYLAECQIALGSGRMLTIRSPSLFDDIGKVLTEVLRFIGEDPKPLPSGVLDLEGGLTPAPLSGDEVCSVPPDAEVLSALLSHSQLPFEPNEKLHSRLRSQFAGQEARVPVRSVAATVVPPVQTAIAHTNGARAAQDLVSGIRDLSSKLLPKQARVMVMTKGDDDLLMLGVASASHFPQQADGKYAGFYPADSEEAIQSFEAVRKKGHDYFILPSPYFWWLSHYGDFASHLQQHYAMTYFDERLCMVFDLSRSSTQHAAPVPQTTSAQPKPPAANGSTLNGSKPNGATPSGSTPHAAPPASSAPAPKRRMPTRMIATKLWGGYSTYALADLAEILDGATADKADIAVAAWEMARWHTVEGNLGQALILLNRLFETSPEERLRKRNLLLEIDLNLRLGRHHDARQVATWAIEHHGFDTDLLLASANAFSAHGPTADDDAGLERLEMLNLIYDLHGLAPLRRIDPNTPVSLDNITGAMDAEASAGAPKVSVIMPAHNAERTIGLAIRSLQEQTWTNLEIIVVDDASRDSTPEIAAELHENDPRVILIRLSDNQGAYAARNAALPHVTGDYVTVHDADDWSHPQKVELQLAAIKAGDGAVGLTSSWIRVSRQLRFNGTWRPGDFLVSENLSSLIVSAETMRALGGWDPVKVNADDEFRRRLEAMSGTRVGRALDGVPLALALDDGASLTRDSRTHVRTEFFGIRRDYRLAFERWHARAAETGDFYLDPTLGSCRRFPAPTLMLPGTKPPTYDVVFACNYALTGGAFISAYTYVLAALRAGLRVGILDWRRYENDLARPADKRLLALIDDGSVNAISAGEEVETMHLVFCHPPILQFKPDRLPNIKAEHVFVTVNQMAERLETGTDVAYEPATVKENLISMFGHVGSWFGISPGVRLKMCNDSRYPEPGDVIWTELLDTETWRREPVWRGSERGVPVIGRHGRDHYTKWPSQARDVADAYCADTGWDVQLLGGAAEAIKVLGHTPSNWTVYPFDALDVREFLDNLDFLVHFPHEDYIEEYGRVVMEAMALGIPVLMPHKFASTFGGAGIYCYPREVPRIIEDIWQDESHYMERGRMGLRYVDENCSFDQLLSRLGAGHHSETEVRNGS